MGLKTYKPTPPGRRDGSVLDFSELTTRKPEKSLLRPLKKTGGRNNVGRITARHRGGGHKRRYRLIDFKRDKEAVPAKVKTIELVELAAVPGDGGGFVATATWVVKGSVGHWGHLHQRTNRYRAEFDIRPVDDAWKVAELQLLEEERL